MLAASTWMLPCLTCIATECLVIWRPARGANASTPISLPHAFTHIFQLPLLQSSTMVISFRSHVWPIADLSVSPIHSSALYAGMRIDTSGFMGIVRGPTRISSPAWLDGPVLLGLQLTFGRHEKGRHVALPQPTRRPIQDLSNHRLHDGCIGFPS